jgi:hypothetical protein
MKENQNMKFIINSVLFCLGVMAITWLVPLEFQHYVWKALAFWCLWSLVCKANK